MLVITRKTDESIVIGRSRHVLILFKVEQIVAACHEGYRSCFFRQYDAAAKDWKTVAKKAFDPDAVYKK